MINYFFYSMITRALVSSISKTSRFKNVNPDFKKKIRVQLREEDLSTLFLLFNDNSFSYFICFYN